MSAENVARVAPRPALVQRALRIELTGGDTPLLCRLKKDWSVSIRHVEDDFKRWCEV
ncbi:hypothetical protein ALQ94_200007 [Pseudomonas amygdali pv. morsprunorum]|uniref:Uncharacterized protein n=1 Tax=Pseudomonas amygdali pv. morsprunorum TaxID=129138 RepID=A0A3M2WFE6_PSEA0|nr:hypothetical protein ALQ94_200007 [Pseudomonas amygdali pv. morsprunorum]